MGLDVYLKRCPNRKEAKRIEDEYDKKSEALWDESGKKYEEMTEAERKAVREKSESLKKEMGLVDYGTHPSVQKIEIDSAKYPDHYFKIGYFRSSYNDGGINNVFGRIGIPDLYDIFQPGDEYEVMPDWNAAKMRTESAINQLTALMETPIGKYDVMEISENLFASPTIKTAKQALGVFQTELEKRTEKSFNSYGNRDGEFYLEGLRVYGFIPGLSGTFQRPCTYVICGPNDGESKYDWYVHALEIVKETIEYVLAQPDKQDYYLCWSS